MDIIYIVIAIAGIAVGFAVDRVLLKRSVDKKLKEAEEQKKLILKEAEVTGESIKKDRILEAKEKFFKMKQEFDEESNRKKNQIISNENKLKQREGNLSKQIEQNKRIEAELESQKENLTAQLEIVRKRKEEFEKLSISIYDDIR